MFFDARMWEDGPQLSQQKIELPAWGSPCSEYCSDYLSRWSDMEKQTNGKLAVFATPNHSAQLGVQASVGL